MVCGHRIIEAGVYRIHDALPHTCMLCIIAEKRIDGLFSGVVIVVVCLSFVITYHDLVLPFRPYSSQDGFGNGFGLLKEGWSGCPDESLLLH